MSKFEFLEERFPKLSEYGRKAEEAFESDKNICLLNLGRIAEYIIMTLCSQNNIHDGDADKLHELGIIDGDIHRKINALIEIKDEAVNEEYDSEMSCERLLVTAEELCRWFMNEKGESKFSFLADLFPDSNPIPPLADLAVYGREAEENLFPNTRYSLICLGDIEESIVEFLLNMKDIDSDPHEDDQNERINILYQKDIISKENKDILHDLRMARNSAVHSRYNSYEEGKRLIDESIPLCEWLFRLIMSPGNFIRGIISRVNDESLDVKAGRIQCIVEREEIPESNESLSERYHEGEKRIFKIKDSQGEIIKLSIKEVYTDPWFNIAKRYEKYKIGQILNVKVTRLTEYMGAIVEIIGPLEVTEARIPKSEYGTANVYIGHDVKAAVKWFSPTTYPYMILSVKDVPVEKDFVSMCADSSPEEISEKISEGVDVNERNHNGMTALMNAAMHNDNPEVIHVLIEAGAKVNAKNMNSSGNTALIFAAMYNSPEVVKALIESGADITVTNSEGMTAYDYALNKERMKDSDVINMLEVRKPLTHDEFLELCKNSSHDEILDALNDPELDVNSPDDNGRNPLMLACISNNADVISALIQKTEDINIADKTGNTALMFACDSNNADAVNALLDSNADITLKNQNGFTAMDFAMHNDKLKGTEIIPRLMAKPSDERFIELCRTGNADIIKAAINAGANLKARDSELNTALMNAIDARNHDAVKILLGHEIEINAQNTDGNNALILSVMNNDSEVLSALLHKNPELDDANKKGRTALMTAAEISIPEMISLLIDLGSDLNHADTHGNTALMIALEREDEDAMNTILEYGADADIQNDTGYNALMMAARTKSVDVVSRLIEITSDINAKNQDGDTALTLAAVFNNADVVNALLDAGADVNVQNKNGTTALMAALYNSFDSENVIRAILMRRPDLNLKNAMERTAFEIAIHKPNLAGSKTLIFLLKGEFLKLCGSGSEEDISLAIDAGADIHAMNKSQATGLMFASQKNTAGAAEILIDAGSDIDAQDINGNTALIYAASYNNDDVADVLIERGANVNIINHSGHKALSYALRNYRLKDTEALRKLKELTHN